MILKSDHILGKPRWMTEQEKIVKRQQSKLDGTNGLNRKKGV